MDYSSLLTAVSSYMNRSDLDAEIPDFIQRAEEEMNARLAQDPVRPMAKSYGLSTTEQRLDLPADFIDVIELTADDGETQWPLVRLEPARQFEYYEKAIAPGLTYDSTKIRHYRILGETIVLSAAPSASLDLTLDCFAKLTPVTDTNATNWLMSNHGDAYLFGTLAHAALRIRDYDFYRENKDLFANLLEVVIRSYPERPRDIARRSVDAPWSAPQWPLSNA